MRTSNLTGKGIETRTVMCHRLTEPSQHTFHSAPVLRYTPGRRGACRKNVRPSRWSSGRGSGIRSNWPMPALSLRQLRRQCQSHRGLTPPPSSGLTAGTPLILYGYTV
jgi:hypothetical protein